MEHAIDCHCEDVLAHLYGCYCGERFNTPRELQAHMINMRDAYDPFPHFNERDEWS